MTPGAGETMAWIMTVGGMALSLLYSGAETGTYVVNKIRLDLRAETQRRARSLQAALRNPGELLSALLIGNNLANYLASAGMVMLLTLGGWDHAEWYALAILTPLVFAFCELLPKNLFYRHGETLVYGLTGFVTVSRKAFKLTGLVAVIGWLIGRIMRAAGRRLGPYETPLAGRGRVAHILAEGQASGLLTHAQSIIADRVVNIGRLRLRDVMVPLEKAALVEENVALEQFRQVLREHGHARYGVYSGQRDHIVGLLHFHDVLLDPGGGLPASHMTAPLLLREDMGIIEALVQLQRRHEATAFVTRDGRCVGLATVKDLVEEIVGELEEW